MITSVDEYLSRLREELSGCDPSTISNALADSEEHLRTALESEPDLKAVIEEYGSPEELAATYRELEGRATPSVEPSAEDRVEETSSRSKDYSVIWIVVGAFIVTVSFALIVAGGGILWAVSALTDDDGYFMTDTLHMTRNSYAVISEPAEIELGVSRAFDLGLIGEFKGEVVSNSPGGKVFFGVAREEDVAAYLENVPHERITDFRIDKAEWQYEAIPGDAAPAPPASQTFWAQSVNGEDTQTLSWELETGTWVFVIMNEDGSTGLDVDAMIGARIPWLFGVGIGFLIGGVVVLVAGSLMIILAVNRRRVAKVTPVQGGA